MKNTKTLIIISITILVLFLLCCNFKEEKVQTLNEYSPYGKLLGTNEYVVRNGDTIMNGKFINYNKNGIKVSEGNFVENEPNGVCLYYYDSGKIKASHYRKNSKITEESIFYNQNGLIEKYVIYDDFGKTSFIISFDEKGVREYEGYPILEVYQYRFSHKEQYNIKGDQVLKIGDTLKYKYLLANIPNAKRSFQIQNISVDNAKVKRIISKEPPTGINVAEVLTKRGVNTIRAMVQYDFNDKITPIFRDTISFKVTVN